MTARMVGFAGVEPGRVALRQTVLAQTMGRVAFAIALLGLMALSSAHAHEGAMFVEDVNALCADDMAGRGLGSKGLDAAAAYIQSRFEASGLAPGADNYRQEFDGPESEKLANIVGVLPGREQGRHVVVGAHYDHLGIGGEGDAYQSQVYTGADDNAAGVAALIEIARWLAKEPPKYPVVFVAFTGEESGLLGSEYYVENPVYPLNTCTAMINLDSVGRMQGKALLAFGTDTAPTMSRILQGVNYAFNLDLQLPPQDPGGSDQVSFREKGVVAVQLFTGPHEDYHRPSDVPEAVNFDGLALVADYASEVVLYLAERDEAIAFIPPGAEQAAAAASGSSGGGRRVSFGSIPDFNHAGDGILLSGVTPESPAEKAGLQAGDVLVEFDGVEIPDLRAFSDMLKAHEPGDEVAVAYERDGERHEATVTLAARK